MHKKSELLGIKVNVLTKDELVEKILEFALIGKHRIITYLNAHCVNVAFSDEEYKKILNLSDIAYADGISVIWASRFLGKPLPERVNILDFSEKLFEGIIKNNISIYFLGGKDFVVHKAVENLRKRFPSVRVLGLNNGYFNNEEERKIITDINNLEPNILIVGMGVPKQEKWIYKHLKELDVNLCWAVGGIFDILSGFHKRAPKWMVNSGLEWFYRLCQEPKRLWKRYLIGNFIFVYYVLRWKIKELFSQ